MTGKLWPGQDHIILEGGQQQTIVDKPPLCDREYQKSSRENLNILNAGGSEEVLLLFLYSYLPLECPQISTCIFLFRKVWKLQLILSMNCSERFRTDYSRWNRVGTTFAYLDTSRHRRTLGGHVADAVGRWTHLLFNLQFYAFWIEKWQLLQKSYQPGTDVLWGLLRSTPTASQKKTHCKPCCKRSNLLDLLEQVPYNIIHSNNYLNYPTHTQTCWQHLFIYNFRLCPKTLHITSSNESYNGLFCWTPLHPLPFL